MNKLPKYIHSYYDNHRFPVVIMTEPPYVIAKFGRADGENQPHNMSVPVEGFSLELYKCGFLAPSDVRANTMEILQEMKEYAIVNIIHRHYGNFRQFAIDRVAMNEAHEVFARMLKEERENYGNNRSEY